MIESAAKFSGGRPVCTYIVGRFSSDHDVRRQQMRDSLDPWVRKMYEERMAEEGSPIERSTKWGEHG
jgi:hypothetical protein